MHIPQPAHCEDGSCDRVPPPAVILNRCSLLTSRAITNGSLGFIISYESSLVTPNDKILELDRWCFHGNAEEPHAESILEYGSACR